MIVAGRIGRSERIDLIRHRGRCGSCIARVPRVKSPLLTHQVWITATCPQAVHPVTVRRLPKLFSFLRFVIKPPAPHQAIVPPLSKSAQVLHNWCGINLADADRSPQQTGLRYRRRSRAWRRIRTAALARAPVGREQHAVDAHTARHRWCGR